MRRSSALLLLIALLLYIIGCMMVFDTSSAEILDKGSAKSVYAPFLKQLLYGGIAALLAWMAMRISWQVWVRHAPWILLGCVFLLILVLIPGIGVAANGSRRWLSLAGFSFQPSEFLKIAAPLYLLYRWEQGALQNCTLKTLLKTLFPVVIAMGLVIVEPDNRTTGIIGLTLIVMFSLLRVPAKFWAMPIGVLAGVGALCAMHVPYVTKRLAVYLNPELDLLGKGHQPYQAKIALGTGGFWGKGLGQSMQKFTYLPEAQNDYIAAIFAEEQGFFGVLILIALYMTFAGIGFFSAMRMKNRTAAIFTAILTFIISFQAFMNFGVVSGLLPSTGLNLPFFSQGGTSLCANAIALGILLNLLQHQGSRSVHEN